MWLRKLAAAPGSAMVEPEASSMVSVLGLHHSLTDSLGKGEAGRDMTIFKVMVDDFTRILLALLPSTLTVLKF